jgi:hypothetical protein
MVDAEENAMDIEAPDTPLFATRLSKISLRDVVMLGALLFTMANYQFNVKAQVDSNTEKIAQVDAHLANTDRIIREDLIPRKEQEQKDATFAAQLAALETQFVQSLMGRR